MSFDIPYRDHWQSMRAELARSVFEQPPRPDKLAFFEAGGMVVAQLAALENGLEHQHGDETSLRDAVRQPFVLGYVFGAGAAAVERRCADRHASDATSVIVTLHQVVLRGGTYDECVAISDAAADDPAFGKGMASAAMDADAFFASGREPGSLVEWLGPRLGLRPGG